MEMWEEKNLPGFISDLNRLSGYDFSGYAVCSLLRRLEHFSHLNGLGKPENLLASLESDQALLPRLIESITVNYTSMFRDADFFLALQEKVFPLLRTYPFLKIWHAGCSTGEEVYSLAILLKEAGLYDKTLLYATDLNPKNIRTAKEGIYPLVKFREYTHAYQLAGGKGFFSDYYQARYQGGVFKQELKKNILFSKHNLALDGSFNEFNLILCRNVLIYFNPKLQAHTIELFANSLCTGGFLALGKEEHIKNTTDQEGRFEPFSNKEKIYRLNRTSGRKKIG